MKPFYKLLNIKAPLFGFSALLLLASCGSYQYAGYDDDGIYSSGQYDRTEAYTANDYEESYEDALYYKQLFSEKSEQFANVPEEGAIFTDIDSYSSGAYDGDYVQDDRDYSVGRPAWGSDPDEIAINIYQDPFYRPFYYPYYAGLYDPFWDPFYYHYRYAFPHYGYGYYDSWNVRFGFGWNSWRHYSPYHYPGYYSPYYGGGYNYPYYSNQNVAYNSSRRGSYNRDSDNYDRISSNSRSSRVRDYLNNGEVRAVRSNADRRNYQTRTTRVRSDVTPVRRSSSYSRGRSTRDVRAVRSQRSRNSAVRPVRSYSRSNSGAVRSSSSSTRSSGTTTRSSRGRGNQ